MKMRAGGVAGQAHYSDSLTRLDLLTDGDLQIRIEVAIQGFVAIVVADPYDNRPGRIAARGSHRAGSGGQHRGAERRREVDALVIVRVGDAVHDGGWLLRHRGRAKSLS